MFERAEEMRRIEKKSNKIVEEIHDNLSDIKHLLEKILRDAKETLEPDKNIINMKTKLLNDTKRSIEQLERIKGKLKLEGYEEVAEKFISEQVQIIISNSEEMTYKINQMEIPKSDDVEEYFKEFAENYEVLQSSNKLAKGVVGVGVASTVGVSVGTAMLTSTAVTSTVALTGLGLGIGTLGTIGSIALGPVGWVVGGISLLAMFGSNPTKEEVSEAREKLSVLQNYLKELYEKKVEIKKTLTTIDAVLTVSENFKVITESLQRTLDNKINIILESGEKSIKAEQESLIEEYENLINENMNYFASYLINKSRKKTFTFKSNNKIIKELDSAETSLKLLKKIKKYFKISKEDSNIINKPFLTLELSKESDFVNLFDKKCSLEDLDKQTRKKIEEKSLNEANVNDPVVKEILKEFVSLIKLIKNIITTPVLDESQRLFIPEDTAGNIDKYLERDAEIIASYSLQDIETLRKVLNYILEEKFSSNPEVMEMLRNEYNIDNYESLEIPNIREEFFNDLTQEILEANLTFKVFSKL